MPPTNKTGVNGPSFSVKLERDGSLIREGARAVAGVAEARAITGSVSAIGDDAVRSVRGAVAVAFGKFCSAELGEAAEATTDADGEVAATGVSTVGESEGSAAAGMSDGFDGLPAATVS